MKPDGGNYQEKLAAENIRLRKSVAALLDVVRAYHQALKSSEHKGLLVGESCRICDVIAGAEADHG